MDDFPSFSNFFDSIPPYIPIIDALPNLRELDLNGNDLRMLPVDMYRFQSLEKLLLENNKIADNNVFPILCTMPNLREVSLAYNFLSEIIPECCKDGYFRTLEGLDLSYNYISDESRISSLVHLPRIQKIILYGNPLLGPTGEDPLHIYVEELVNMSLSIEERADKVPLEIVTEIPKKRRPLKKGEQLGRQTLYRNFEITYVNDSDRIDGKNNADWKATGNVAKFDPFLKKLEQSQTYETDPSSFTFLTAPIQPNDKRDNEQNAERIVSDVMGKVAGSIGLTNSAEILALRDVATSRRTPHTLTAEGLNNTLPKLSLNDDYEDGDDIDDKVPFGLFTKSLADASSLTTHPVTMTTAVQSLKHALKNPLTNYSEVPAKGFLPPHNYVRQTKASKIRQMPKVKPTIDPEKYEKIADKLKKQNKYERGLTEASDEKIARIKARDKTLAQIEDVLDSLNESTNQMTTPAGGRNASLEAMRNFARPQTGISNLVNVMNEVVSELGM